MAAFRKRGNKWEYRASFKNPFTQEYKVKSKGGFSTKKEAQIWKDKLLKAWKQTRRI